MAVDRRGSSLPGFALFTAVIIIAVIAVLSAAVLVAFAGDNDRERIERTADVLQRLVSAMDTTKTVTSFGANVGKWPGKLSQLVIPLTGAAGEVSCSGATFTVGNWKGPYYLAPIPTTGYPIAAGFTANDALVKVNTLTLAIVMPSVSLKDAQLLGLEVDNKTTGAGPYVVFSSTNPTTSVQYRLISATTICP